MISQGGAEQHQVIHMHKVLEGVGYVNTKK